MFRSPFRSFVLLVVLLTLLGSLGPAAAQDATPPSAPAAGTPEPVAFRTLAAGSMDILAPGTANLGFGRVNLAPGASVPFDPNDPSAVLVYIASGTATFNVEAEMTVARAARAGTPVPPEPEAISAGTEFTLSDGDSALFPPNAAGEVRNDGTEDAVAWVTNVALFTSEASTPTP
jgi:quercetin dioxygenase-like cupin family protein